MLIPDSDWLTEKYRCLISPVPRNPHLTSLVMSRWRPWVASALTLRYSWVGLSYIVVDEAIYPSAIDGWYQIVSYRSIRHDVFKQGLTYYHWIWFKLSLCHLCVCSDHIDTWSRNVDSDVISDVTIATSDRRVLLDTVSTWCQRVSHSHSSAILTLYGQLKRSSIGYIRYSMFAYADMIIYPHLASQYHAWPLAVRGTVVLRVDKFLCKRQQTEVGVGWQIRNNMKSI